MSSTPWSQLRHDLRNPVNTIVGYSQLLVEELQETGDTWGTTELAEVKAAGYSILFSINQILAADREEENDLLAATLSLRHATRTPLNAISGYCQLLLEQGQHYPHFIADFEKIQEATFELRERIETLETQPIPQPVSELMFDVDPEDPEAEIYLPPSKISYGRILVVDDRSNNRHLLTQLLIHQNYRVETAANGRQALQKVDKRNYDLILLDILMPEIDGYDVLCRLKGDRRWQHIPVIMISALDEIDKVVDCIKQGANDYLPKPFNPVLLRARIEACLGKKRLRDRELIYLKKLSQSHGETIQQNQRLERENQHLLQLNKSLELEKEKYKQLAIKLLPTEMAKTLQKKENSVIHSFEDATILLARLTNFTQLTRDLSPEKLVDFLNEVFSTFDRLTDRYSLEKIKAIGGTYMVVGGVPNPQRNHAELIADMALAMHREIRHIQPPNSSPLSLQIGINTGTVIAGAIGVKKMIYDLWGDAVNIASEMESQGIAGETQVTQTTYDLLKHKYYLKPRGTIEVKGEGEMLTYFLKGKHELAVF